MNAPEPDTNGRPTPPPISELPPPTVPTPLPPADSDAFKQLFPDHPSQ